MSVSPWSSCAEDWSHCAASVVPAFSPKYSASDHQAGPARLPGSVCGKRRAHLSTGVTRQLTIPTTSLVPRVVPDGAAAAVDESAASATVDGVVRACLIGLACLAPAVVAAQAGMAAAAVFSGVDRQLQAPPIARPTCSCGIRPLRCISACARRLRLVACRPRSPTATASTPMTTCSSSSAPSVTAGRRSSLP